MGFNACVMSTDEVIAEVLPHRGYPRKHRVLIVKEVKPHWLTVLLCKRQLLPATVYWCNVELFPILKLEAQ